jgi:hypothetical protein
MHQRAKFKRSPQKSPYASNTSLDPRTRFVHYSASLERAILDYQSCNYLVRRRILSLSHIMEAWKAVRVCKLYDLHSLVLLAAVVLEVFILQLRRELQPVELQ